jgi:hypothetical protein
MKYLPSSGSEEEEAENKRPAPGPDYDTRRLWYLRFDKKVRDSLIREFPSYSVNEINKLVSQMWKDLNEVQVKQRYYQCHY